MNEKLLKKIILSEGMFVPLIFTKKQLSVIQKYSDGKKLSNADKKALYTSIKKKLEALDLFSREQENKDYFISGSDKMIISRIKEAKSIIDQYSGKYEKVFVSGSFLFSKDFNDIDIFIIWKRGYKEEYEEKKHSIFLTEKKLAEPIFQSASLISVSNFILTKKIRRQKPKLYELMSLYHEAIIEKIRNDKKLEATRKLVFTHYLFCKNNLLSGKELSALSKSITVNHLNFIMKEACIKIFSQTYLYVQIHEYIKTLSESIKNIQPNNHLLIFKQTYEELIYGKQRSKTENN